MKVAYINEIFVDEVKELRIPTFMLKLSGGTLFGRGVEGMDEPLSHESLTKDMRFAGQNAIISFEPAPVQMVQFDVKRSDKGRARVYDLDSEEREIILKHIQSLSPDRQKDLCRDDIYRMLNKNDQYGATDLKRYIGQVLDHLDESRINWLNAHKPEAIEIFSAKIEELMTAHQREIFFKKLASEQIYCAPSYSLPKWFPLDGSTDLHGGSLYEREHAKMTDIEAELVMKLSGMKSIRWWHKIVGRRKGEFFINGFINHYPDFMVRTERGNIVMIETKGAHLANAIKTINKIDLGEAWEKCAGKGYRYFMVFKDDAENIPKGSYRMSEFLEVLKAI